MIPRGIRNNNPLNIRIGNKWKGETPENTDGVFEQFTRMEYGVRAAFILLRRYINRYHLNSVEKIVSRWAPRNENHTEKYIEHVCKLMAIFPTTKIAYEDKATMFALVDAMAIYECGQSIPLEVIRDGYTLATLETP